MLLPHFLPSAALGILYLHGLGVKKDTKSSFLCLKGAAERGNIYAIGQLSLFYYKLKLFNNAVDFAQRFVSTNSFPLVLKYCYCYTTKGPYRAEGQYRIRG